MISLEPNVEHDPLLTIFPVMILLNKLYMSHLIYYRNLVTI